MEYKDKRTLSIMSGLNKNQEYDDGYHSRKNQRELERKRKKSVTLFYLRSTTVLDRLWWSLLSDNDKYFIATHWLSYKNANVNMTRSEFLIIMKKKFDKTLQIRDKKLESIL